jgi:predicted metal-binding membrane protein
VVVANVWVIAAAILAIAGAYQFTELKYRCLDKCRAPLSFVIAHWCGAGEKSQAFLLGIRHGVFCVGCCWCLMLMMFVIGSANIGWMLALGAVMAAEKNLPAGRRLAAPIGIVLLLAAVWVAVTGATV